MKKLLILLLAGLMLVGCGPKDSTKRMTQDELNTAYAENIEGFSEIRFIRASDEDMKNVIGIDPADLDAYIVDMPMMIVQSTELMILLPKDGKMDTVKAAVAEYMSSLETQWSTYLPDQYELVVNRVEKEVDGYYIVVIAEDAETLADKLVELIK